MLRQLAAGDLGSDVLSNTAQCPLYFFQGLTSRLNREVDQIDVHGKSWHISHKEIDRGAAFQGQAWFSRNERKRSYQ